MEARILTNANMEAPEYISLAGGRASVFSARSPDPDHEANEDSAAVFAIDDGRAVLALADGVGGVRSGEVASRIAIRQLQLSIEKGLGEERSLRGCILDAFENANLAIADKGLGAATTLAVVEFDAGSIRPYHAGDSEIIAVGLRGKVKFKTVAHSPVGYAVESGVIDAEEAMEHDDRHLVSNVVGNDDMRIEIGPTLMMARRDTVILASDGLTDNLHTDEIVEMIRKGPLDAAARRVVAESLHRMHHPTGDHPSKPDDLTFIIFRRAQ